MTKITRQSRSAAPSKRPRSAEEGASAPPPRPKSTAWTPAAGEGSAGDGRKLGGAERPADTAEFLRLKHGARDGAATEAAAIGEPGASTQPKPTAFDVTDDAAVARLAASPDPKDKELAKMMKTARATYGGLIRAGARVSVVANDQGNSGRPVVTLTPKALVDNPTLPFAVQMHFHGMDSTADRPAGAAELPAKLEKAMAGPPPRVFVMPTPTEMLPTNGRTYPVWTSVTNTRVLADQALAAVGLPSSSADRPLTVSAHSAGGRAVAVAQAKGGLDCDRLELEDCLYGVTQGRADSRFPPARDAALAWAAQHPRTPLVYVRSAEGGNSADLTPRDLPAGMPFEHRQVQHHYDAALR